MTIKTRNQGVCALARYLYGPSAHRRTYVESKGVTYEIADPSEEFQAIIRQYHRDDGGSGFATADAKSLVEEFVAVRKTLTAAIENGGEWRGEQN